MNPNDQIKALADLDGWTFHKFASTGQSEDPYSAETIGEVWLPAGKQWASMDYDKRRAWFDREVSPPNYLTSYDAILPLIQKQPYSVVSFVHDDMCNMNDTKYFLCCFTPQQLCEALLRATGKWKE